MTKKSKTQFLFFLILPLISLFLLLNLIPKTQQILTRALGKKAEITVDTQAVMGDLPRPWQALAQGGEEKEGMLTPVIQEIVNLQPVYIRLDHIFDFYDVVQRQNGRLTFNFQKLDLVVDDILKTGAKPFFSLSFTPPEITSGDIVSPPQHWSEWELVVKKTIEHYSGHRGKNIKNVYYEVWSEPDLFGGWGLDGEKNYLDLYFWSAQAAQKAENVQNFKLGGPATSGLYPNWIEKLIKFTKENNLKLDFISWHRYHRDPQEFSRDLEIISALIEKNLGHQYLEKIISEWGSDSKLNPWHDNQFDAAHEIVTLRNIMGKVRWAFSFEIKDGLDPGGEKFWGRWGMLTHQSVGVFKKPRYWSRFLLGKLRGARLYVLGEGSWVKAIASKNEDQISLILSNFDQNEKHQESFPVIFKNLEDGQYLIRKTSLEGLVQEIKTTIKNNSHQEQIYLGPNEVLLIELFPTPG